MTAWAPAPGVVELPDGARVRGRGIRAGSPGGPDPDWTLYLLGRRPPEPRWPHRWLRWPDFWLPLDRRDAVSALQEAHRRAATGERVELVCGGGIGRTGTALACLVQLAGVGPDDAVRWVRAHYDPRAVETPWQRRYVRRFPAARQDVAWPGEPGAPANR